MKSTYLLVIILVLANPLALSGQKAPKKITISGFVTDSTMKPVSGAFILIDNQKSGIITDEKGSYRIRVSSTSKLISVFTLKNGISETVINGRSSIDFIMNSDITGSDKDRNDSKDGETVNVGYGTMKKKDMSTSVEKIDGTNNKYASYPNIYEMLRGAVPGVQVTGNKIIIQGTSSFYLSSDPLFVVDGLAVNSIDDISPRMVKSVEVLKGAAASIYGSRGTNGVILIYLLGAPDFKK
jgi:TonB-dependent SusC/RagA subfamily outer membrane receptor